MIFQNYLMPKLDKYKTALNERTFSLSLVEKVNFKRNFAVQTFIHYKNT